MAHFYGVMQGGRGSVTRTGTANSGIETIAASWNGCIRVALFVDEKGRDCFRVEQAEWQSKGIYKLLAEGVVGE